MDYTILQPMIQQANSSSPSSPQSYEFTEEDEAFLYGIVFTPSAVVNENISDLQQEIEAISARNSSTEEKVSVSLSQPQRLCDNSIDQPMGSAVDLSSRHAAIVHPDEDSPDEPKSVSQPNDVDILCVRGAEGNHAHKGNVMFRHIIQSKKPQFDAIMTFEERIAFAENLWSGLRHKGSRFLRRTNNGRYEILDYERSVRKIHFALRDCRTSSNNKAKVGDESTSNIDFLVGMQRKVAKKGSPPSPNATKIKCKSKNQNSKM